MRVLCSTTAGTGHFGPMAPVARACVAAGHEVRVAAPESFESPVVRAGLTHEPFADVPPEVLGPIFGGLGQLSMDEANATVMRDVFGRHDAQSALPALRELVASWQPDVVLREPAEFGSLAAAVAAGVPHVEVTIGVAAVMEWARPHLVTPLAELDALVGLPTGTLSAEMVAAPRLTMMPASLDTTDDPERRTWRYRVATDTPAAGRLPEPWGDPDLPLVYVTFGSITGGFDELAVVYRGALDALAGLPVRALLTTGYAAADLTLEPVPPNARVETWWPQDDVMPAAAVVVGHGGFGTTMSALAAGVPQVVLPLFAYDQGINADRVEASGVGMRLPVGPAGLPGLAAAVRRVLDDGHFRERAAAVAGEIVSLPDASEMVSVIESCSGGNA